MNELRMYVERLFEGRMLTSENIELKEEIYGNLVARYEDYVANGMSEDEALEKTKESITSVEDVLAGEDDESADAVSPVMGAAVEAMGQDAAAGSGDGVAAYPTGTVGETHVMPGVPASPEDGASTNPVSGGGANRPKPWLIAVAIIAAVAVLLVVWNMAVEPMLDRAEDAAEAQAEQQIIDQRTQDDAAGSGTSQSASQSDAAAGDDADDAREYQLSSALDQAVAESPIDTLKSYTGGSFADAGGLVSNLPLGEYMTVCDYDASSGLILIDYEAVPEDLDDDALDRAMVYNAVALLSVYSPDAAAVRVSVQEERDGDWDTEMYQFERTDLEELVSRATNDAVTQLNSSLYESLDQWNVVRNAATSESVYDPATDRAEMN